MTFFDLFDIALAGLLGFMCAPVVSKVSFIIGLCAMTAFSIMGGFTWWLPAYVLGSVLSGFYPWPELEDQQENL